MTADRCPERPGHPHVYPTFGAELCRYCGTPSTPTTTEVVL